MRELVDLLDQNGQELAFEPIDYGHLFGHEPLSGTIGGTVAINAAGPRRIKPGAARDHLLGFTAVSGRGDVFQSGGRVMKNVTGYDLSKLMAGSYGTLAVFTDLTLKVLPKAEMEETLLLTGLDEAAAVHVMTEASGLPHEVSSFAHLPKGIATDLDDAHRSPDAITALRLEGPEVSGCQTQAGLDRALQSNRRRFQYHFAQPLPFVLAGHQGLPSVGQTTRRRLAHLDSAGQRRGAGRSSATDGHRASRLLRLGRRADLACNRNPGSTAAPTIRETLKPFGGHATLIRATKTVRTSTPVFQPQPPALAALTARIKTSFDPEKILNRGRMRDDL